jgi:hypothetical protein
VALGQQGEIDRQPRINQLASEALRKAEGGLVGAVDQAIVVASIEKTNGFFAQMTDASKAGDYKRMASIYPERLSRVPVAEVCHGNPLLSAAA